LILDLRLAWRRLHRAPVFATTAVATVALAIGANTAILSVADAVLFRPLGYGDADRLRIVQMRDPSTGQRFTRIPPEYLDVIERLHGGVGEVGYLESGSIVETGPEGAVIVATAAVSTNYFRILDVSPYRGRFFDESDAGSASRSAVLSHSAWQSRFAGDPAVVGTSVVVGATTWDIVGVLPPAFTFPSSFARAPDMVTILPPRAPDAGAFNPVVRLEPGVTANQAQAELDALGRRVTVGDPNVGTSVPVLDGVRDVLYATGRPIMVFLLAAATLVLLIACANLTNLYLAASRRREREMGVAGALGASRIRLIRPVVLETTMIAVMGAVLALVIASFGFDFLVQIVPQAAYGDAAVGVDYRVAGFALGMGLVAGLATAVVPAWRATRLDPHTVIRNATRSGDGRRFGFGRPMVAVQVALAVVVVFGAAIAARAFVDVLRIPLGFTPDGVALIEVPATGDDGLARQAFYGRVIAMLDDRADVAAVGATGSVPVVRGVPWGAARPMPDATNAASIVHVLPGYFETAGIELVAGRMLGREDAGGSASSAVVSESAARALFGGRDPVGMTFVDTDGTSFTVVGVVRDVRMLLEQEPLPPAYVLPGNDTRRMTILVRPREGSGAQLASLRSEVSRMATGAIVTVRWWDDAIGSLTPFRNPRFQTVVLAGFAVLALGVTALGIIGVIAFTLALRRREMGIRLALGMAPRGLVGLMMRYALAPVVVGLAAGLLATRVLAQLAEAQLFEVETRDPLTLAATVLVVLLAASAAAWLPARRVTRLDPIGTLKAD
jgi:predicted permease